MPGRNAVAGVEVDMICAGTRSVRMAMKLRVERAVLERDVSLQREPLTDLPLAVQCIDELSVLCSVESPLLKPNGKPTVRVLMNWCPDTS